MAFDLKVELLKMFEEVSLDDCCSELQYDAPGHRGDDFYAAHEERMRKFKRLLEMVRQK